ncbi:fasciclin domain-containing protein, partial [Pseudoxanthomonas sp. SGD-10]
MEKSLKQQTLWAVGIILFMAIVSCRKTELVTNVSDQVNMTTYFKNHPEQFSELSKILTISGTASFLNAYGAYTFFAPDNKAIASYLSSKGKASVDEVDKDEWRNFIRFHLLEDSIPTSSFTDGKLPQLTMYGQYLVTGSENVGGQTKIRVNRQANISTPNISVGNGLIHVIDGTLEPAKLSLAKAIEQNPNLSIFTAALKATGIYDDLDKLPSENIAEDRKWLTVIAESDEVLASAGINNFQDLKDRYSDTGNPEAPTDSLNLYVNYHILYEAKYLADIISSAAHPTLAPLEVITSKLTGEKVLINDDIFNGVHELGFELTRAISDVSCTNGVLHFATEHFGIKKRSPFRVDFDVCTFP